MTTTEADKLRRNACAALARLRGTKGRARSVAHAAWLAAEDRAFWAARSAGIDKLTKERR